ncbi:hypothetical protein CEV33_3577 [Brucella grignonensis]|uniref:Uncharacterized protein n=1 Tax=Brucella grignonensis TaxID=94627 RepID=A0A256EZ60_9HYPH|nr:hypothetical protein CEV33_3577 [Brucella grignonensis]
MRIVPESRFSLFGICSKYLFRRIILRIEVGSEISRVN